MSDPSVEAARKALKPFGDASPFYPRSLAVAAAREMAKSVQELHRPVDNYGDRLRHCHNCSTDRWPCETAKRVYPSEELER